MLTCTCLNDKETFIRCCKSILEELNKPEYVVYGSQNLSDDTISFLKDLKCEYCYVEPKIFGEPEDCFFVIPSKILNDYCYKEDYYE